MFQNDVPRTHKTDQAESFEGTAIGDDIRRDLDQRRRLTYLQLHAEDQPAFFDRATVSLSWQFQEEEQDRIRSGGERELQGFEVGTLGLFAHLSSPTSIGRLTYGVEYYHDEVDSFLDKGAAQTPADDIQGPVGDDASYDLLGVFVQNEIAASERLDLILGARFDWARADADSVRDENDMQIAIDDDWSTVVGNARALYRLTDETNLYTGVSQGFRAPNLSDLTRFDAARSNEFEIPSPGLDPEHYTSYELGVKFADGRRSGRASVFYTDIRDQIVRFPTGPPPPPPAPVEVTKDNLGDGHVWGIELLGAVEVAPRWTIFGSGTFLDGEVETFPDATQMIATEPISREMPITVQLGVRHEDALTGAWYELTTVWADDADDLSTRDEDDDERIPPGGTPGFVTADLRAGWRVGDRVTVVAAVENVFDETYRIHGSGLTMPGRNFVLSLTADL